MRTRALHLRLAAPLLLVALLAPAGAGAGAGAEPAAGVPGDAGGDLAVRKLFRKLIVERVPDDAKVLPRHDPRRRRRLRYEGTLSERSLARSGRQMVTISAKAFEVRRVDLVEPAGSGLARAWFYSEARMVGAEQAGRKCLDLFRERPSGGMRLAATARRLSGRGLEHAAGDLDLQRQLAPVPEMPRLPSGSLTAGRPLRRTVGDHLVSWRLAASATLGKRKCWVLTREVQLASGARRGARPVTARAEYVLDAGDFTVLGLVSRWGTLAAGGGTVLERVHQLRLTRSEEPAEKELAVDSGRVEKLRALLRAVSARDVARSERTLGDAREARCPRAGLRVAERFVAAEKQLSSAEGGARRIELVPEDTFVFVSAPGKIDPKRRLIPVVFLHGAAARAETYFKDWRRKAGKRPLLLIFPQARDWTWNAARDGAVIGSLLDVLGRTYKLDRGRLVFAGHAAGGELAMLLAYGANFPGYRVRGMVSAGALMAENLRRRAFDQKPPALLARLRSVDAFVIGGLKDKKIRPEKVRNLASWLQSYNPRGVELELTPKVALRYATEWTPEILGWIEKLPSEPRTGGKAPGRVPTPHRLEKR